MIVFDQFLYYNIKAGLKTEIINLCYLCLKINSLISELISEIEVQANNQSCIFFLSDLNSEINIATQHSKLI